MVLFCAHFGAELDVLTDELCLTNKWRNSSYLHIIYNRSSSVVSESGVLLNSVAGLVRFPYTIYNSN